MSRSTNGPISYHFQPNQNIIYSLNLNLEQACGVKEEETKLPDPASLASIQTFIQVH